MNMITCDQSVKYAKVIRFASIIKYDQLAKTVKEVQFANIIKSDQLAKNVKVLGQKKAQDQIHVPAVTAGSDRPHREQEDRRSMAIPPQRPGDGSQAGDQGAVRDPRHGG